MSDPGTVYLLMIGIALLAALFLIIEHRRDKKDEAAENSTVPAIISVGEHPQAILHYDTGPHKNCFCRVCNLQREIEAMRIVNVMLQNKLNIEPIKKGQ